MFAEVGDVRRDFVAAQAGHFDGGTENLDVVVIGDGAVADNMARGEFGVGGDFVDFTHRGAWDVVGEEKRDEVVALLRGGPFTDHGVELVNQFEAALMVLVVRMRDEFLARSSGARVDASWLR